MQLTQETKKVVRSNQFQESKFKIEASQKAFQILSSRLYADGIKAIVRELCTNASDAHAAAGIPSSPIHVHCPNMFDQTFSVRDFGNGIDPEDFEKIFTTYFYSTKSDSNEQVGCFGLGSKSPFAYTQQFTVENYFGGFKYVYSCFINENGEPSVSLLSRTSADDAVHDKGVKISFPVKRENWYDFEQAAKKVLQWFDFTPKCNVAIDNHSFKGMNKRFAYGTAVDAPAYGIRMGQVVYPVNSEYFEDFLDHMSIINVNIGDVDITPSRESLEYSKRTIATLEKLKAFFAKEFEIQIDDIMAEDLSDLGKYRKMYKFFAANGIKEKLKTNTIQKIFFPNAQYGIRTPTVFANVDEKKFNNELVKFSKSSWRQKLDRQTSYLDIHYKTIILIKDKNKNINFKMDQIFDDSKGENVSVLLVPSTQKDKFMKEFKLRDEDVIIASEYELRKDYQPPTSSRVSSNCSKIEWRNGAWLKKGTKLDKTIKNAYYITDRQYGNLNESWDSVRNFNIVYEKKGSPQVFIFTEAQYNSLKISSRGFTNFLDEVAKEVEADKKLIIDTISADIVTKDPIHSRAMKLGEKTISNNGFKEYYKFHNNLSYDTDKVNYYNGKCELIKYNNKELYNSIKEAVEKKVDEYTVSFDAAKKKCKMVEILIDNPNFDGIIDSVVEYIDMMENKGE